jgi:hypothetical protein
VWPSASIEYGESAVARRLRAHRAHGLPVLVAVVVHDEQIAHPGVLHERPALQPGRLT